MRKQLIVNADDFGLTDGVNRAVIEGHRHGIITSATLMANGRAFESAVEMAATERQLGIGVHLNLVDGPCVAAPSLVPSLVDASGRFARSAASLAMAAVTTRIRIAEVETELRHQIERVLEAGVRVTHVDGHKHAHLAPRIFDVVVRVAADYGIRGIRCAVESGSEIGSIVSGLGPRATLAKQWASGGCSRSSLAESGGTRRPPAFARRCGSSELRKPGCSAPSFWIGCSARQAAGLRS